MFQIPIRRVNMLASKIKVERVAFNRSTRVKCIDIHPTEDWVLCALYTGEVVIWASKFEKIIKSFQVCELPVRTVKFITRQSWVIFGSDDGMIRVFNYQTLANIYTFWAHSDYIRCIVVHPIKSCILSCSDDVLIRLWDWSKDWSCIQTFESHAHFIMQVVFNPKDDTMFASASLDRTVKVWTLGNTEPNFTLLGHEKGVNSVNFCHTKDRPYIASGADDCTIKVWDYQNRTCIHTLQGHNNNVTVVLFHPTLPLLLSASEDGSLKIWNASVFNLDSSHNYGYERAWTVCATDKTNDVVIGYDEGVIVTKIGIDRPAISMDAHSGKVVFSKHSEIRQVNVRTVSESAEQDGDILPVIAKDMGTCEIYPQYICHSQNGRFLAICDGQEYIVYTSLALRTKCFGRAKQFAWGDSTSFAVLDHSRNVIVYKNFEKLGTMYANNAEEIFGGRLLGVKTDVLSFYKWDKTEILNSIEIAPQSVFWSADGERVCLKVEKDFYVLMVKYQDEIVFELLAQIGESINNGVWVNQSFIYTDSNLEVRACIEGATHNVARLDKEAYVLGYINEKNRLYLCNRESNVLSYYIPLSVLDYETAVLKREQETAERLLNEIPEKWKSTVAHFLDQLGFKQEALILTTEQEHRFELALSTGDLAVAEETAAALNTQSAWSKLGCAAGASNLELANRCFERAGHYAAIMLYAISAGDRDALQDVAKKSRAERQFNVAFLANFLLADLEECIELLLDNGQTVEAAFFARSYLPSKVADTVNAWRKELVHMNPKLAASIADPHRYANLFPEYEESLVPEKERKRTVCGAVREPPSDRDPGSC